MAEQAKILRQEAEENNLGIKVRNERFRRWETCSLCEQNYHGVVRCALGWACWKTYVGRPEADQVRRLAMQKLGNGLSAAGHHEDEMSVRKAELAMLRRLSASEYDMLVVQTNLACTYHRLGRLEEALRIQRDVYSGYLKLFGEESHKTLLSANNYAVSLVGLKRFEEAKSLLRKTMPVARRVLGDDDISTLRMRMNYGRALYEDPCATLDDLRKAVTTLEEIEPIVRRVLGGAHPVSEAIETSLRNARAALTARDLARETLPPPGDTGK